MGWLRYSKRALVSALIEMHDGHHLQRRFSKNVDDAIRRLVNLFEGLFRILVNGVALSERLGGAFHAVKDTGGHASGIKLRILRDEFLDCAQRAPLFGRPDNVHGWTNSFRIEAWVWTRADAMSDRPASIFRRA